MDLLQGAGKEGRSRDTREIQPHRLPVSVVQLSWRLCLDLLILEERSRIRRSDVFVHS